MSGGYDYQWRSACHIAKVKQDLHGCICTECGEYCMVVSLTRMEELAPAAKQAAKLLNDITDQANTKPKRKLAPHPKANRSEQ